MQSWLCPSGERVPGHLNACCVRSTRPQTARRVRRRGDGQSFFNPQIPMYHGSEIGTLLHFNLNKRLALGIGLQGSVPRSIGTLLRPLGELWIFSLTLGLQG